MKKCNVELCENKVLAKGYCNKHYKQNYKYGKTLIRTRFDNNKIICYDNYAEILLYNSNNIEVARTIIDIEDVEKCKAYKWYLNRGYVHSKSKNIKLHRFLLNINNKKIFVDHINRNTLDNRKCNLRPCTNQENLMNSSLRKDNTSGIKGVYLDKKYNKWVSQICHNGRVIYLGKNEDIEKAIKIRLQKEKELFGDFAPQRHLFEQYEIK